MFRLHRTLTLTHATDMPRAVEFSLKARELLGDLGDAKLSGGPEIFGSRRIHWYLDAPSLDRLQAVNRQLATHAGFAALVDEFKGIWVEGSQVDVISRLG